MKRQLKNRWIKALRSGHYKQGTHVLRRQTTPNSESFCCLGVLCEIAGFPSRSTGIDGTFEYGHTTIGEELCFPIRGNLSGPMRNILGIDSTEKLIELNDSGETFENIANYIEVTL